VRQGRTLTLAVIALWATACGSSSTSVTAPSANKCSVSATTAPSTFPSAGGSGTVTINTTRECAWTVASQDAWVIPGGSANGQGDASLPFTVAANSSPTRRTGALIVQSTRLEVAQDGAPCRFSLNTNHVDARAEGGAVGVRVEAMTGCTWTAQSLESWIGITSGTSGNGSGDVQLSIAGNGGLARQGAVVIAGQTLSVTQAAPGTEPAPDPAPPAPSPTPPPPPPPPDPPPPSTEVELDGLVADLSGSCPNLTFVLNGTTVYTDEATGYRQGNCHHVENGRRVYVLGERQPDGRVRAKRVDIKEKG
jgi:hypothetical protein